VTAEIAFGNALSPAFLEIRPEAREAGFDFAFGKAAIRYCQLLRRLVRRLSDMT
jgi:hypothetical protein